MTLFITRPAPDAERTVAVLRDAGIDAAPAPLMEIRQTAAAAPHVDEGTILAFTSANGVRAWIAAGGPAHQVFAVGETTAQVAEAEDLPVEAVADGDVEALFSLLKTRGAGRPILHVRGRHARGHLTERLKREGHHADAAELYEAAALTALPANLAEAIAEGGHAIGLFSPRTMQVFLDLTEAANLTSHLPKLSAICFSLAVADSGARAGFQSVHVAARPELSAFVDTARLRRT